MNERIKDLEEDVKDAEKALVSAEEEVRNAIEWRDKMKLSLAEDIIRLHKARHER